MVNAKKLTGLNPLAYMGVEPITPPLLVIESRRPTIDDSKNFNIGTVWVMRSPNEIWMLVDLSGHIATWIQLYPGAGAGAESFPCDTGTANEAGGVLNVLGDTHVRTSGAGNTVTLDFDNGTNGQILIGGGAESSWEHITSTSSTIVITNGANSINLETAGGQGVDSVPCDIGTATPDAGGILEIFSAPFAMLSTSGAGNRVTLDIVNGTNGQVLIGGGTDATWANITSTGGSITITEGVNTINLETTGPGGTGSFFAYQNIRESPTTNINPSPPNVFISGIGEVAALTELYDTSNAFFPGDGAGTGAYYTAPLAGKYLFMVNIELVSATGPTTPYGDANANIYLEETSATYGTTTAGSGYSLYSPVTSSMQRFVHSSITTLIDMGLGDIVEFNFFAPSSKGYGVNLVGLNPNSPYDYATWICGFLVG